MTAEAFLKFMEDGIKVSEENLVKSGKADQTKGLYILKDYITASYRGYVKKKSEEGDKNGQKVAS